MRQKSNLEYKYLVYKEKSDTSTCIWLQVPFSKQLNQYKSFHWICFISQNSDLHIYGAE